MTKNICFVTNFDSIEATLNTHKYLIRNPAGHHNGAGGRGQGCQDAGWNPQGSVPGLGGGTGGSGR